MLLKTLILFSDEYRGTPLYLPTIVVKGWGIWTNELAEVKEIIENNERKIKQTSVYLEELYIIEVARVSEQTSKQESKQLRKQAYSSFLHEITIDENGGRTTVDVIVENSTI